MIFDGISNRLGGLFRSGNKAQVDAAATKKLNGRIVAPSAKVRMQGGTLGSKQSPASVEAILRSALGGDIRRQFEVYELMEDTWARLAKNLHELKTAASRASYAVMPYVERGEEPTSTAQEKADYVQQCLDNWKSSPTKSLNGFQDCVYDLCDAIGKGWSAQEIIWEASGDGIQVNASAFLHPMYYGYPANEYELKLSPGGDGLYEDFQTNKFIVATYKNRSGNSVGYGLMRQLAYWWAGANHCRDWLLNYAQIFGQPLRFATYDPNASDLLKGDIADMLENMGSAAWGAFPHGTNVEFKEASKGAQDNPQAMYLELADRICDITILGQTLTTDVGDSGSRALGDVHQEVRLSRLEDACLWVANVLSEQLIPAICELNYGNKDEMPSLTPSTTQDSDPMAEAQRDQIILGTGVELPKQWFYERHDIPVPKDGEKVLKQETPLPLTPSPFGAKDTVSAVDSPTEQDALLDNVLEDLTGITADWLAPAKPAFSQLVAKALDDKVTDSDFARALALAGETMPDIFDSLNTEALAGAMERNMGAAMINGAMQKQLEGQA